MKINNYPPNCYLRADGRVVAKIAGKTVTIGAEFTPAHVLAERHQTLLELARAHGGRLPDKRHRSVNEIGEDYLAHAVEYYTKRGKPTSSYHLAARVLDMLRQSGHGDEHPDTFGPLQLANFRGWLCARKRDDGEPYTRATITSYMKVMLAMFRWAESQEFVPAGRWETLKTIPPLRRNRPPAPGLPPLRESPKRKPVPEADYQAARAQMHPVVAAMVETQVYAAMRPEEVCLMRCGDLSPVEIPMGRGKKPLRVVAYRVRPDANKLDYRDIDRVVFLGPRAMQAVRPWLTDDPDAFVFSPAKAMELHQQDRRAKRKTPLYPSHLKAQAKKKRKATRQPKGSYYTTAAYTRAVARACERAGLTGSRAWTTGRLRHTGASVIANAESLEVAQLILGHSDIKTTLRYVTVNDHRAALAALRRG